MKTKKRRKIKRLIIISLILTSCNPFISKDLRYKNRVNRKITRFIKKYPEALTTDTIKDTVLVKIPKVKIDTFVQIKTDTTILAEIKNDTIRQWVRKYIKTYQPIKDTITQKINGYTFSFWFGGSKLYYSVKKPVQVVKKVNKVVVQKVQKVKLTIPEKIMNVLAKFWRWIVIVIILIVGVKIVKKTIL